MKEKEAKETMSFSSDQVRIFGKLGYENLTGNLLMCLRYY